MGTRTLRTIVLEQNVSHRSTCLIKASPEPPSPQRSSPQQSLQSVEPPIPVPVILKPIGFVVAEVVQLLPLPLQSAWERNYPLHHTTAAKAA